MLLGAVKDNREHVIFKAVLGMCIGSSNIKDTSLFIEPSLLYVLFRESITIMT